MNKHLGRGHQFPILLLSLTLLFMTGLAGCHPAGDHGCGIHPYNEDTVRNHVISASTAREYTASFRMSVDSFNKNCAGFKDNMKFGYAEAFPSDVFYALLGEQTDKQGKAVGIRIYYGRGSNGDIKMVLVPYDKDGNDMLDKVVNLNGKPLPGAGAERKESKSAATTDGQAVEDGQRCPTVCSTNGGLN